LAGIKGKTTEAEEHIQKVLGITEEECKKHIKDAFALWRERNENVWELDISLITSNGISQKQIIKKGKAYF
jgi:hypothetical protein